MEADKLVLRKEAFNPQAVIATVIKIVGLHSARLRLNIGYHLDENVPELVIGDAMRVQQVLLNTINNAIKFTEKGDIMIRMYVGKRRHAEESFARANKAASESDEAEDKEPTTREWREEATRIGMKEAQERARLADWLERPKSVAMDDASTSSGDAEDGGDDTALHFYVKDTGIGLSSSSISTIFNSFQQVDLSPTRKYDGTGLGLAISQRLCEAMGGRMWAESPVSVWGARSTSASGASRLPWRRRTRRQRPCPAAREGARSRRRRRRRRVSPCARAVRPRIP